MKAYGRKNPIRYGAGKNRKHSRRGNVCPICNNTKVSKGSARQKMKRDILWSSWSDLPEELRNKFEKEIEQNNEMIRREEIKPVEITDFTRNILK